MRQRLTESNKNYLKRLNSNLQTLELAGGKRVLAGPYLMEYIYKDNLTDA